MKTENLPFSQETTTKTREPRFNWAKIIYRILVFFPVFIFLATPFFFSLTAEAATGINKQINFQGKLVDSSGLNVADNTYSVIFTLYDAPSGGNNLWQETDNVTTNAGIFQVALGAVNTNLGNVNFNSDTLYLGIKVGADAEMTPRIRFSSVPYALNAGSLSGVVATQSASGFTMTGGMSTLKTLTVNDNTTLNNGGLSFANGGGLALASGKTLTANNSLTFSGTDGTTLTLPGSSTTLAGLSIAQTFTAQQTFTTGTATDDTLQLSAATGGGARFNGILTSSDLTGSDKTWTLPNASGTICISGQTCASSGAVGYWTRTGTNLSPATATDTLSLGTTTPLATLDVRGNLGTTPAASFSATSTAPGASVDQSGTGDIFLAANTGATKFVVANSGNVGIGKAVPTNLLDILSTNTSGFIAISNNAASTATFGVTNNGNARLGTTTNDSFELQTNGAFRMKIDTSGQVSIGASTALASFDVRGLSGATPVATFSGTTGKSVMVVDQSGTGDIFAASKSGASKFVVLNNGNVQIANLNAASCDVKADATGLLSCGTDATTDAFTVNTYTSNGTWNAPSGIKFAQVIVTGAGGGGGGARTTDTAAEAAAGAGGAGGTSIEMLSAATLGSSQSITIGTAGSAGANTGTSGGAGGGSSFGSLTTANGGSGGTGLSTGSSTGANGGAGGAATATGDVNIEGGDGDDGGALAEYTIGGSGGSSYWGGGGAGGRSGGNAADPGSAGVAYGSGGGGAATEDLTNQGAVGGSGASGVVVVMSYRSTGADLAEWYETTSDVSEGDIVAISPDSYGYNSKLGLQQSSILQKATVGRTMVGIVSSAPFQTMGTDILESAKHPKPIALAGRVPVTVSEENGTIRAGDVLTLSTTPGVAMRAIKAGPTIGTALEDAACVAGQSCKVLVMVNASYTNGAMLKGMLQDEGLTLDTIPQGVDIGRMVFAKLLQEKSDIRNNQPLSEISTDLVSAGLEIVSPKVTTDVLATNKINSASDKDITMQLGPYTNFLLTDASGSARVKFDDKGNAYFAGRIIASGFDTDEKASLAALRSSLASQSSRLQTLEDQFATSSAAQTMTSLAALNQTLKSPGQDVTVSGDLQVTGNSLVEGILNVVDTITSNNIVINKLATFFGNVIFHGNVSFDMAPTFTSDTAGYTTVQKGSDMTQVSFTKEYPTEPIVNASLVSTKLTEDSLAHYKADGTCSSDDTKDGCQDKVDASILSQSIKYVVTDRSTKGFSIKLETGAREPMTFSWTALSVGK